MNAQMHSCSSTRSCSVTTEHEEYLRRQLANWEKGRLYLLESVRDDSSRAGAFGVSFSATRSGALTRSDVTKLVSKRVWHDCLWRRRHGMAVCKCCDVAEQGRRKMNKDHPWSFWPYLTLFLMSGTLVRAVISQLVVHDTAFAIHQPMTSGWHACQ